MTEQFLRTSFITCPHKFDDNKKCVYCGFNNTTLIVSYLKYLEQRNACRKLEKKLGIKQYPVDHWLYSTTDRFESPGPILNFEEVGQYDAKKEHIKKLIHSAVRATFDENYETTIELDRLTDNIIKELIGHRPREYGFAEINLTSWTPPPTTGPISPTTSVGGFTDINGRHVRRGDKVFYRFGDRTGILHEALQDGDATVLFNDTNRVETVKWCNLLKIV